MTSEKKYDVLVVGSGATGGFAAKELTENGLDVIVLEAGPLLDESSFHKKKSSMKGIGSMPRIIAGLTGQHIQARASFYSPDQRFLFVNDLKNPYSYPSDDFFLWIRSRNVGGRFMSWGRVALRMSDYAFKSKKYEGVGEDWPISYEDIAPYYDKVEDFLGIIGSKDNIPFLPDGKYIKTAGYSSFEKEFKETVESKWPERKVIPWRYVSENATPVDKNNNRISSPIAAALATGNLELRTNAIVTKLNIDPVSGKATGVEYIDAKTKKINNVSANVVVLCASTIESIRILFNSANTKHPDGVGNSSDLLGRYFMDQVPSLVFGTVPHRTGWELVDGTSAENNNGGIYIPRFQNLDKPTNTEFKGGFNIQGIIGRGYVPDNHPAQYGFMGHGEMLPYYENRITINPKRKDAWGIPVPYINIRMGENERNLVRCQLDTTKEMLFEAGYSIDFAMSILGLDDENNILPNANWFERFLFRKSYKKSMALGAAIHECGGAKMGEDPNNSVLNPYNQCWDAKNIFVTDSSCFPTNGSCGPTLTTMAITMRACEYIANEYGKSSELSGKD
ncbi:MAG: GMC family oxidoreductase [Ignavibacteria bacterium]|jgi:choline dehydrogenase-like flavoprotein